jgi:competence protein ComEC
MDQQVIISFLYVWGSVQHWFGSVLDWLFVIKMHFLELVVQLSQQQGHQLYAVLLSGNKKLLSDKQRLLLEVTGMQHLFSVSGMHLSLVIAGVKSLLTGFLGKRTAFTLVVVVWFYAFLVDFRPSVLRAGVMTSISLLVRRYFHRSVASFYLLFLTVLLLVSVRPTLLTQIGFQLSVMGVVGVLIAQLFLPQNKLTDLLSHNFSNQSVRSSSNGYSVSQQVANYLFETSVITAVVSLLIFPLVLFYFGEVTFASLVANPLVLWLAPLVMSIGGVQLVLTVCTTVWPKLLLSILYISRLLDIPLQTLTILLQLVAALPIPHFERVSITIYELVAYYICLFVLLTIFAYRKWKRQRYVVRL